MPLIRSTGVRPFLTSVGCVLVATLVLAAPARAFAEPSGAPGHRASATPSDGLSQSIEEDQAVSEEDTVLSLGHVDLGPRYVDGAWTLMVHDDTDEDGSVWRPLEHAVVQVSDAATREVPDDPAYGFLGVEPGAPVHVVPQTQDPDVVWLGWNTQDPQVMASVDRGVTLSLAGVEGPGDLLVYLQDGGFGEPDVLWDSRSAEEQELWVDVNTHTHANWVFTRPGVYLVSIRANATLVDGSEDEAVGTVRFAVGDGTATEDAFAADAEPTPASVATATEAPEADRAADAGTTGQLPAVLWVLIAVGGALAAAAVVLSLRGRRVREQARSEAAR